jgi:hypothetical protein
MIGVAILVLVETAQSVTAGSMKQLLKDVVCHGSILEHHNAPFLILCADGPTSANLTGVVARIALRGRYSGASIL